MRRAALLALVLSTGCATLKGYDGPAQSNADVATIAADARFNAGLPVVVALRKVDDRVVGIGYSKVALEPGRHQLLIDCTVKEWHTINRFPLTVDVEAGAHYRLTAELEPGNRACQDIHVERH